MFKRAIQATVLTGSATVGVAPGATITIKDAVTGALRTLWSDFAGTSGTANPVTADANGQFLVYANPGRVQITVTDGTTTRIWEDVELGHDDSRTVIINGDFRLAQRGTSFAAVADGDYTLDRWGYKKFGAMVHTITQDSDVPTQAQAGTAAGFSLKVDCTTLDAVIGAGDFAMVGQPIEGYNLKHLLNGDVVFFFWAKATKTGIYCVNFRNGSNDRSYVEEFTINDADTWELKAITLTMHNGETGTWDFTNGVGLRVFFVLAAGSTFQTTPSEWKAGEFYATANQVNACDSIANDLRISLVNLEAGTVATAFKHSDFAEELARSKYYLEVLNAEGVADRSFGLGYALTTSRVQVQIDFVQKRATPVGSISAVGDIKIRHQNTSIDMSSITFENESRNSVLAQINSGGMPFTVGQGCLLIDDGGTNSRITINAELTL